MYSPSLKTLWTVLYKAINWDVNQIVMGPASLYDKFITDRVYLIEAGDYTYTTDIEMWSALAGGVPINVNKALWLIDRGASQDDLIFAVEGFTEKTHSSHAVRSIKRYSPTDEDILTIWTAERTQRADDPTRFELANDSVWHNV